MKCMQGSLVFVTYISASANCLNFVLETDMDIIEIIDSYAAAHPDRFAHILRENTITYKNLFIKSNRLANFLINQFDFDKTPIIVYGHKQNEMLVSFLACAKAGHAYIPVDSSLPQSRVEEIINNAKSKMIICIDNYEPLDKKCEILDSDKLQRIFGKYDNTTPDKSYRVKETDVYYIIYTSGSTGKPKGVQITLANLHSFIRWSVPLANVGESRAPVILNAAPFSFDLSVMDVYISLAVGGTLFSIDKDMIANARELFTYLNKSNASVCVCTPSFADMCLADSSFNSILLPNIKCFLFCGETLTNRTANKLLQSFPLAKVVNLYGPTETTVAVTEVTIDQDVCDHISPLPVGRVKNDCEILIMDTAGNLVPESGHGEIVIAGESVSVGYYDNPEMTEKTFFVYDGKCAYRTGDEGYLKDGMLYYCGRLDFQVKLNGYRIEIEDIENNIRKLNSVENAFVVPSFSDEKLTHLNAFVVLKDKKADKSLKGIIAFKRNLKELIPEYMVPKKIIFKDKFLLNSNGKIDRKTLSREVK